MFVKLLHQIQKIISDFFKRTYTALKVHNWEEIINSAFIISIVLAIIFVITYKLAINIESLVWHTHSLVLSSNIKNSLPQLYFFFLLMIATLKWILNMRRGKIVDELGTEKSKELSIKIPFLKKSFAVTPNTIYSILLIGIILLFFVIKIPSWNLSFTVNQPLKYSTYTEPALKMFESHDPFIMQTHYMNNPLTDSRGIGKTFGNLPALEWTLYVFYSLFNSFLSFEVITRLVMCLIGAAALVSIFKFVQKAFSSRIALFATFILAINPIFNLASFVTVYDTINIALTFYVFSLILNFKQNKKLSLLLFAGVLLGIGVAIKENILLWTLPVVFALLFRKKQSISSWLTQIFGFMTFAILPGVINHFSINYFPTKQIKYFIFFFVGLLLYILLFKIYSKIQPHVEKVISKAWEFINKYKILYLILIAFVIFCVYLLYQTSISEEFLTDWRLLFNIDLYIEFIQQQAIPYCTIFVAMLALIALIILAFRKKGYQQIGVVLALLISSFIYIILASKVLFFHSYYWLFIIISVVILAVVGLDILFQQFSSQRLRILFLFSILGSLALPVVGSTRSKLNREVKQVYSLVDFIDSQKLDDGTSFIDQGDATYLTFKTDIYRVYDPGVFANKTFKNLVARDGLSTTMDHYKIKYLITSNENPPDYFIFANTFSISELASTSYRRTDAIYSQLYPTKYSYYPDLDNRKQILKDNNIEEQFYVIKYFGAYTVYGLTPACFNVVIE